MTNAEILEKYLHDAIGGAVRIGVDIVEMMIKQDRAKDPERLRQYGEWIRKECEENEWYCSICGSDFSFADIDFTPYNSGLRYCPDCGAKMDK